MRSRRSSSASRSRRTVSGRRPRTAGKKRSRSTRPTRPRGTISAIAYEHEGKFEEARKAYEKALELDPKSLLIRQNYDLFKEINDRTKRRNDRVASRCSAGSGLHELLRDAHRDAHPAEDGRVGVLARPYRRFHRRRHRRCGCEPRDGASAAQSAAVEVHSPRHRSRSVTARGDAAGQGKDEPAATPRRREPRAADGQQPAAPTRCASSGAEAQQIRNEKDLERYQGIFADVAFWKKIGEEYQNPLIVTGTVLFTPNQTSGFVTRRPGSLRSAGAAKRRPGPGVHGAEGIQPPAEVRLHRRPHRRARSTPKRCSEEILYPAQQNTPALSSYFELMDQLVPNFLSTLSTQKIRGTRVLLK